MRLRAVGVRLRVSVIGNGALSLFLLAAGAGQAQAPPQPQQFAQLQPAIPQPVTGFVPPYEIVRTLRAAGLDPVAPPLREGTMYVLRATDFRGILVRVVVDAHTGAIRDVNRIVSGPGAYGQMGIVPPPTTAPPPFYGPTDFEADRALPSEQSAVSPSMPPPATHRAARPSMTMTPLPRPRPASFASSKRADEPKPSVRPDATTDAPPAAPVVPKKEAPAAAPLND